MVQVTLMSFKLKYKQANSADMILTCGLAWLRQKDSICTHLQIVFAYLCTRQWHPTPVLLLENPMDGGAWWAVVHGVAKSRTRLSNFTFTFHFHALEKEMATHSSILAWRIPGTEEPGGLPSMGSHRVGHNWSDVAAAALLLNNKWIINKN